MTVPVPAGAGGVDERLAHRIEGGHWMVFDDHHRVSGCHCGFRCDMEQDCGYGDSFLDHFEDVVRAESAAALAAAEQRADTLAAENVSLAERQSRYLEARGHTLSTDGMERDVAIEAQALYVLGEASELHAACKGGTGGWGGTAKHWRCEIADVVLATVTLANILGVTVEDCIEEKTEEDRDRDRRAALSSRPVQPEGKQR